ncbi:MAG: TMEM43 family protein [Planctomycetaceae bacterium]|nr:TMEM43 family protein [Planctomycetaceae bacterium]
MSTHTVTTSKGWFERLGNSFGGIIFGVILFIAGTILLWWNEGNFVKTQTALNEAQGVVTELGDINTLNTASNGQLVHATGQAVTDDMLADPVFGISTNAISLERAVEYYQWVEDSKRETRQKLGGGEETVTTYTYKTDWARSPVDSSWFNSPDARTEHKNTVLATFEDFKTQAVNVQFGAYRLPKFLIDSISGSESYTVELSEDVIEKLNLQIIPSDFLTASLPGHEVLMPPSSEAPAQGLLLIEEENGSEEGVTTPSAQSLLLFDEEDGEKTVAPVTPTVAPPSLPQWVHVSGSTVYLGQSPAQPTVGNVRVTFKYTKPVNEVSIIAKLNGNTFETFIAANGKPVSMLSMGTHSAENMFASAHAANTFMMWILRIVGVILVIFSLRMIVAPLEVLASVVPFLGKLVGIGVGLVCMLLGAAWSLLIIALAWLFYRPLIAILILAVVGGLIAFLFTKLRSDKTGAKV